MLFVKNNYQIHDNNQRSVYILTIVALVDVLLYNDFDFGIICQVIPKDNVLSPKHKNKPLEKRTNINFNRRNIL